MATVIVSDEGPVRFPADLRRRLELEAGARLELLEEPDGLRLRVLRPLPMTDVTRLAGMIRAPVTGVPRRLEDFIRRSPLPSTRASADGDDIQ